MARPSFVRHRDVKAAIKAVEAAGKAVQGVKIHPDGSIELVTTPSAPEPRDDVDREYEKWRAKHGAG